MPGLVFQDFSPCFFIVLIIELVTFYIFKHIL